MSGADACAVVKKVYIPEKYIVMYRFSSIAKAETLSQHDKAQLKC